MLKFFKSTPYLSNIAEKEKSVSAFIPYIAHFNKHTVITKNRKLVQVVKLEGFSFETADSEDLDIKKNLRNLLFKGMGSERLMLYTHVIRKQKDIYPKNYSSLDMPEGFAEYLDQQWVENNRNRKAFINEIYIALVYDAPGGINVGIAEKISKVFLKHKSSDYTADKALYKGLEVLDEAMLRVINTLRNYTPTRLELYEEAEGVFSGLLEFLSLIVNCGQSNKMLLPTHDLSSYIDLNRLYFKRRHIEVRTSDGKTKYAGMVSLKEYGQKTWPGMLDTFLQLPFEFILTQSYHFEGKQAAISKMQLQQNRMIQSEDKAFSQISEITYALDMAMSGEIGFGRHHLSILCISDDERTLEDKISQASVTLTNTGNVSVREKVNMEPAFWGQLPGNSDFIVRLATINTLNFAGLNSFHNYPTGKQFKNHWGDGIAR